MFSLLAKPVYVSEIKLDLFWKKVDKSGGDSACWIWTAARDRRGYGKFDARGRDLFAHRVSFALTGQELQPDMQIDHLCRNRSCVNPAHLEQVSQAENTRRAFDFSDGRQRPTHCRKGHEFAGDNLIVVPPRGGGYRSTRRCRACLRQSNALSLERLKVQHV